MTHPIRTIVASLTILISSQALAQTLDPASKGPTAMQKASSSAERELASSIQELNTMRTQVAAEKLPIAQELTALEEGVIELRRGGDRVQRLVDAGALEIGTLKSEIKAREDELAYLGGLLDEYARTFETKIGVGELQVYGEAAETAKNAVENKSLAPSERFGQQVLFTELTIKRLFDMIGGTRFAGTGVDMLGGILEGQFAMLGPITLFRANNGTSGIAVSQVGSTNPLIRPLEAEHANAIGTLVATGEGTIPLDPSRGGALKALVQKTNLFHIFEKGGPIMWPLLLASIIAVAVAIERFIFLVIEQYRRSEKALGTFFAAVRKRDLDAAILLSGKSKDVIVMTLGYALEHRDQSLGHALDYAETRAFKRYRRGLSILDTVITLAPLLGLLGTVTGMMASFSVIGGDLSSPGAITGGISEALIATAFGLIIAIMSLLPFNYLNTRIEAIENEMLAAGAQLKLLVETPADMPEQG